MSSRLTLCPSSTSLTRWYDCCKCRHLSLHRQSLSPRCRTTSHTHKHTHWTIIFQANMGEPDASLNLFHSFRMKTFEDVHYHILRNSVLSSEVVSETTGVESTTFLSHTQNFVKTCRYQKRNLHLAKIQILF